MVIADEKKLAQKLSKVATGLALMATISRVQAKVFDDILRNLKQILEELEKG